MWPHKKINAMWGCIREYIASGDKKYLLYVQGTVRPCVKFARFSPCIVKCEVVQGQMPGKDCLGGQKPEPISGASNSSYFREPPIKS